MSQLTRSTLRGVWSALIVVWKEDDTLDEQRFAREVASYAGTGVAGVYTGGTTGEFYAQDDQTFERITAITCEQAHAAGLPVQIGCTTLSSRTARLRIRTAIRHQADAIQIAPPFWLELKDDEMFEFMRSITGEAGDVPIVLYHTSRHKRKFPPAILGELAHTFPTFIGMKDTGCDVPTLKAMLQAAGSLSIFGGENDLVEKMQAGGQGAYSSIVGISAKRMAEFYSHCAAGRWEQGRAMQDQVNQILDVVLRWAREDGLLDSAIDRVMRLVGGGDVNLRCQSPYRSANENHLRELETWMRANLPQWLPVVSSNVR